MPVPARSDAGGDHTAQFWKYFLGRVLLDALEACEPHSFGHAVQPLDTLCLGLELLEHGARDFERSTTSNAVLEQVEEPAVALALVIVVVEPGVVGHEELIDDLPECAKVEVIPRCVEVEDLGQDLEIVNGLSHGVLLVAGACVDRATSSMVTARSPAVLERVLDAGVVAVHLVEAHHAEQASEQAFGHVFLLLRVCLWSPKNISIRPYNQSHCN